MTFAFAASALAMVGKVHKQFPGGLSIPLEACHSISEVLP